MIDLSHQTPFAAGYNRLCFVHPDDPGRCLKVIRPENIEARYTRQPMIKKLLGKQRINDNRQEIEAHARLPTPETSSAIWAHLPRFFGTTETSLGPANVSELITEADGSPAKTLEWFLTGSTALPADITAAIDRFCDWLAANAVMTRNLLPHNLVVAHRQGQPELFLVDGLGAPTVPARLASISAYRNRYITRKIARFHQRIQWELDGRPGTWEQAQKLTRRP